MTLSEAGNGVVPTTTRYRIFRPNTNCAPQIVCMHGKDPSRVAVRDMSVSIRICSIAGITLRYGVLSRMSAILTRRVMSLSIILERSVQREISCRSPTIPTPMTAREKEIPTILILGELRGRGWGLADSAPVIPSLGRASIWK